MEPKKEIFIRFKEGEKEAEMTLNNLEPEHQLAMLDGMFKFFDIDVAFKELAEISLHTRKAYHDFYVRPGVVEWTETNEAMQEVAVTVEESVEEKVEEKPSVSPELIEKATDTENWKIENVSKEESHWYTGIKVKNGVDHFRLRYKCPSCGKDANIYIKKNQRYVSCYDCGTKMMVKPATKEDLGRDQFGNYFVAGNYEPEE